MIVSKSRIWEFRIYNSVVFLRPVVILICLYILFAPIINQLWSLGVRDALIVMACLLPSIFLIVEVIGAVVGFSVILRASRSDSMHNSYARSLRSIHWSTNFSLGFAFSLWITFLALDVGLILEPGAIVPLSSRFLMTNFVCDGLTLWFTLFIMRWAVSSYTLFKLPIAIILDIAVAATLAIASLYFGLLGEPFEITVPEAAKILTMNYFNISTTEFGPLFWVMHTTFLPTLIYCILIGIGWIGKLVLYLWLIFTSRAVEDRPLALTASLFGAIAGIIQGYVHFI